jgi:hypothetical protein
MDWSAFFTQSRPKIAPIGMGKNKSKTENDGTVTAACISGEASGGTAAAFTPPVWTNLNSHAKPT